MTEARLRVSPDLSLPLDAVTDTFALLAMRGAGKSNGAVTLAEEMFANGLPWVAIDPVGSWWGIRAAGEGGPGLPVLVFGGQHGDLPLEPGSGRMVADLVADQNLTCVLDLSLMDDEEDLPRFATAFLRQMFLRNQDPRHVFFEEADVILPQVATRDTMPMLRAGSKMIKLGRGRGLGCTLITQRSASLNKAALAQTGSLIAMRTTWPPDKDAILQWMRSHSASDQVVDALPGLADGEAFVFSPSQSGELVRVRFRRRHTYDSGATPKVGQRIRPPTDLASIDLGALREAMAATLAKAAADDPDALQARIRVLERQLAERPPPEPARVQVPVLTEDDRALLASAGGALHAAASTTREILARLEALAGRVSASLGPELPAAAKEGEGAEPPTRPARTTAPGTATPRKDPAGTAGGEPPRGPAGPVELRAGARRMVEALGRMHPLRLTKSQWGTVARLKTSGGTWSAYLSDIRRAGFLDEDTAGAGYTLTKAGFDYLGGQPAPMTARELQDHYRRILRAGAATMLDALIGAYPAGLSREELGAIAGLATTGGTFSAYLSDLIRNGLAIRSEGGAVTATSVLVHGPQLAAG